MPSWIHEDLAIVATIDPIDANNADSSTDIIDMSKFHEVSFLILLGVLNDSATNTVTVLSDGASNMATEAALSGKSQAIVGTDDAKQFIITVRADELPAGHRYIRATMANSAHSQLTAIVALGRPRFKPATDDDLTSVQTPVA